MVAECNNEYYNNNIQSPCLQIFICKVGIEPHQEGFRIGDFRNVFKAMVLFDEMPTGTIRVDPPLSHFHFVCGNHSSFFNKALLLLENVRYIGSKYDVSFVVKNENSNLTLCTKKGTKGCF